MLDQVYGAIADPTRREILGILAEEETNVGRLAERFPISLNAVFNPEPLREATMWLEHYRTFWEQRLGALEEFLLRKERRAGSEHGHQPEEGGR